MLAGLWQALAAEKHRKKIRQKITFLIPILVILS